MSDPAASGPGVTTIPAVVDRAASMFGSAEGLVDTDADGGDLRLTFAEFADRVTHAGRALIAAGIQPGDRVCMWAPNIWEWAVVALGVHSVGGIVVPISTRLKGTEAADILLRTDSKLLFTVTDFLDTDYASLLDGIDVDLPALERVVSLRGAADGDRQTVADFLAAGEVVEPGDVAARSAAIDGDDIANIMFTSGTTGRPKGVMLRHHATVRAYDAWSSVIGLNQDDRYLIINPFSHSFGLNAGILACLLKGATILPHAVFDVPAVMERVPVERISMLPGPPAIYQTILNHPDLDRFDMSSLRLAVTGAAPVPVPMIHAMREKLGFEVIVTGYGLTEATGIATMCRHDDPPEIISGTSGRAIPDVEVRIVDDEGTEMPTGEPGEIVVRGYNIMAGYLDDPEATAEAIDADGWLRTGDIGVMDDGGNIDITDRKKDMFIVGGFNAYPAEIENLMLAHDTVGQVAVVGTPDDRLGEVGVAFVVPAAGATVDPDELVAWSKETMANYKAPRRVVVLDELPMNVAGNKVDREALKAQAAAT